MDALLTVISDALLMDELLTVISDALSMDDLLTGCIVCGRVPGEHRGQESIMHRSHQHHPELVGGVQLLAPGKGKASRLSQQTNF
jgi:hypothetical protein